MPSDIVSRVTVESSKPYADHLAAEKIERAVHSVTIGYRLTLAGAPPVEVASWHQDPDLELYTIRVRPESDRKSVV